MADLFDRRASGREWVRGTEEFARVLNFSDALFAIALTLLIVTIEIPPDTGDTGTSLLEEVLDKAPQVFGYVLSFTIIGFYWLAHHRLVADMDSMSTGFVIANLAYLGAVAFMPFPTGLLGEHAPQTLTVGFYAACAALVSGMETVLLVVAYRARLFRQVPSPRTFRFAVAGSTLPVALFLLSIPVAIWQPTWAMLLWALTIPLGAVLNRMDRSGAPDQG